MGERPAHLDGTVNGRVATVCNRGGSVSLLAPPERTPRRQFAPSGRVDVPGRDRPVDPSRGGQNGVSGPTRRHVRGSMHTRDVVPQGACCEQRPPVLSCCGSPSVLALQPLQNVIALKASRVAVNIGVSNVSTNDRDPARQAVSPKRTPPNCRRNPRRYRPTGFHRLDEGDR